MRRAAWALGLLGIATVAAGCQPRYDGVQIRFLFGDGQHAGDRLEISEGQAVLVSVRPQSSNPYEDYESFDLVTLESANEAIMLVAPATEIDEFVLAGAGQGTTIIRILINDEQVDELQGTVAPQVTGP